MYCLYRTAPVPLPTMLWLPQASATLCSWCEQSGHPRLVALTSLLLRPAWQQASADAAAAAAATADSEVGGCARAALRLLVPCPWQARLLARLVVMPCAAGLMELVLELQNVLSHDTDNSNRSGMHDAACAPGGSCRASGVTSDVPVVPSSECPAASDCLDWPQQWCHQAGGHGRSTCCGSRGSRSRGSSSSSSASREPSASSCVPGGDAAAVRVAVRCVHEHAIPANGSRLSK
jgi:hypothetical protein